MRFESKTSTLTALFVLLLSAASSASAQVYKCRQPDGSTQISNAPCEGGSKTVKTVEEEAIPDDVREQAEARNERQRKQADAMAKERKAEEAAERKERERLLKEQARLDKEAAKAEQNNSQPAYYYGGTYYRPRPPYPRPPHPDHDLPVTPTKPGKPVDLYKVPPAPKPMPAR